jgi:DNA-binding NarL/FixJ family response regulator
MPRRTPDASAPPPARVRASIERIDGVEHLVLSFPLPEVTLPAELTDAERAIARLLLTGRSNRDIALARGRAVSTVAKQIAALYRKLGVGSRAELAARVLAAR